MTKRVQHVYDDCFRLGVVRDYYESGMSKNFIVRKYGLSCRSVLLNWLRRYPLDIKDVSLSDEVILDPMAKSEKSVREVALEERVRSLEKALEYEKLRSHALDVLISIAEKNEGISIRKKTGVKQ